MKCARVRLQQRSKITANISGKSISSDKPRRYCQKRLVDPEHEEDPRWIDAFERFHCNGSENNKFNETINSGPEVDDVYLSVQNLKFHGDVQQRKRPRTSFKYKTLSNGKIHRMFVRQVVQDPEPIDDDQSSQLTCYYYDDYAKYLSADRSRSSSEKSSICFQELNNTSKENKSVQVDITKLGDMQTIRKSESKKLLRSDEVHHDVKNKEMINTAIETKIALHKCGKGKSLTISRVQSPETTQVIRVDVVCHYGNTSRLSYYEENKKKTKNENGKLSEETLETIALKKSNFAHKYLLSDTKNMLKQNLGSARVTLLCKTFRLSDRAKVLSKRIPVNITKAKILK